MAIEYSICRLKGCRFVGDFAPSDNYASDLAPSDNQLALSDNQVSDLAPPDNAAPSINGERKGAEAARPATVTPGPPQAAQRIQVRSRAQAIALLDQVQRYFRLSEPSSPVPMLCERARAFAERDFMAVLREVLPKAALRDIGAEK